MKYLFLICVLGSFNCYAVEYDQKYSLDKSYHPLVYEFKSANDPTVHCIVVNSNSNGIAMHCVDKLLRYKEPEKDCNSHSNDVLNHR